MRPSSVAVLMASIILAAPGSAQITRAADAPVLALVSAYSDARAQFNAQALDALLTSDYVEVSPVGEVDRRQAVLAFYGPSKAAPAPPMTLGTDDVRRYGDIAIVVGSVNYAIPSPKRHDRQADYAGHLCRATRCEALADGIDAVHRGTTTPARTIETGATWVSGEAAVESRRLVNVVRAR